MSQMGKECMLWMQKEVLKEKFQLLQREQQAELVDYLHQVEKVETFKDHYVLDRQVTGLMTIEQKKIYQDISYQRHLNYWQERYFYEVESVNSSL